MRHATDVQANGELSKPPRRTMQLIRWVWSGLLSSLVKYITANLNEFYSESLFRLCISSDAVYPWGIIASQTGSRTGGSSPKMEHADVICGAWCLSQVWGGEIVIPSKKASSSFSWCFMCSWRTRGDISQEVSFFSIYSSIQAQEPSWLCMRMWNHWEPIADLRTPALRCSNLYLCLLAFWNSMDYTLQFLDVEWHWRDYLSTWGIRSINDRSDKISV